MSVKRIVQLYHTRNGGVNNFPEKSAGSTLNAPPEGTKSAIELRTEVYWFYHKTVYQESNDGTTSGFCIRYAPRYDTFIPPSFESMWSSMMETGKKLKLMVSSTVYGIEDELERIYSTLTSFGYDVWMSHMGTLPVFSNKSAFENCREGVRKCDIFLGIIGCQYGSGIDPDNSDSLSIVHQELQLAIELQKPRWLLAHENVVFARQFLKNLQLNGRPLSESSTLTLKKNNLFSDLRLIDMYEEAMMASEPLEEREGNWVHKFNRPDQASRFLIYQFYRYQEVQAYIEEHFKDGSPFKSTRGDE